MIALSGAVYRNVQKNYKNEKGAPHHRRGAP